MGNSGGGAQHELCAPRGKLVSAALPVAGHPLPGAGCRGRWFANGKRGEPEHHTEDVRSRDSAAARSAHAAGRSGGEFGRKLRWAGDGFGNGGAGSSSADSAACANGPSASSSATTCSTGELGGEFSGGGWARSWVLKSVRHEGAAGSTGGKTERHSEGCAA